MAFPKARALLAETGGGARLVVSPSNRNLHNDVLRPLVDRLYRGFSRDAHDLVKRFKLIGDAVGTEVWTEVH